MNLNFFFILLINFSLVTASELSPITDNIPPNEELTIIQPPDELTMLDHYIEVSTNTLAHVQVLRQMVYDYQKLQEVFIANAEDHDLALKMIKAAFQIRKNIIDHNLDPLFSQDFLNELALFSNMAKKKGIPKL